MQPERHLAGGAVCKTSQCASVTDPVAYGDGASIGKNRAFTIAGIALEHLGRQGWLCLEEERLLTAPADRVRVVAVCRFERDDPIEDTEVGLAELDGVALTEDAILDVDDDRLNECVLTSGVVVERVGQGACREWQALHVI